MTTDWTVLLIGGAGGAGKTTAAKEIARRTGAAAVPADDIWLALQRAVPESDASPLHAFRGQNVSTRQTSEVLNTMRDLAVLISSALEPVVGTHLWHNDRVVIEGVWITPEFMRRENFSGSLAGDRCRAVVAFEDDVAQIRRNFFAPGRGFDGWLAADRDATAAVHSEYARWLRTEAARREIPVVASAPLASLAERILAVV